ncbi:hypothetical protein L208DRAFT_1408536 [Tricholoma matsutake]|nr:hypothetical protein L208DRAFT_1408536 [Tricholoma matsutake 945]
MNPDVNLLANEDVYPVTTQTYTAVQLAWFLSTYLVYAHFLKTQPLKREWYPLAPRPTLFIFLRF